MRRPLISLLLTASPLACGGRPGDSGGPTHAAAPPPTVATVAPAEVAGAVASVRACPSGEVYIPATGPEGFVMGKGLLSHATGKHIGKGHWPDTDKPHRVVLTRPFCMDALEVTAGEIQP